MNFKKILGLLLIFLCINGFADSSEGKLESEFELKFEEYSKLIKTIQCDFTQEKTMRVLEKPVLMKGSFYYDSCGDICLNYKIPSGNKIIFCGENFLMSNSGNKTVAALSSNPMLSQLSEMLTACMTGNISMFRVGWKINYAENNDEYIITLTPTNKKVARMVSNIVLHFVKTDMTLSQMKMTERDENISAYKFFNKVLNKELKPKVFTLN